MLKRVLVAVPLAVMLLGHLSGPHLVQAQQQEEEKREVAVPNLGLRAAKVVATQMNEKGTKRIPSTLRQEAQCIVVFPGVMKAGFLIAVKGGQGLGSCRHSATHAWGAPALFDIAAGSVGLQAGIQTASVILLVTNQVGVQALMKGKVAFGPGLDLVAGPVGGSVEMKTAQPFLSYVRTKGLFAGVDLEGATLTFASEATEEVYGTTVGLQEVLFGDHKIPESLKSFHETLQQFAP